MEKPELPWNRGTIGDGLSFYGTMRTTGNRVELLWYNKNGEA
jgi:hypothetical protein